MAPGEEYYFVIQLVMVVVTINMAMAAAPMSTTLSLARDESEAELIGVGMKRTLTMTATFSASSDAVTIELIPSVTDTVFAFVKIVSTRMGQSVTGGDLDTFSKRKGSEYSDTDGIAPDSSVVFELGDITVSAGSQEEAHYQIEIVYEVVMVSIGSYSEGDEFWTSCGMLYDGGSNLWISQISFTLTETIATVGEDPVVTCTSDVTEITIGQPLTVGVSMKIPYARSTVTMEARVLGNSTDLFVTKIAVTSAGEAFSYQMRYENLVKTHYTCPLASSLSYQFGPIINKDSQAASPDPATSQTSQAISTDPATYEIIAEVTIQTTASLDIVGDIFQLGLGLDIDSIEIWVTTVELITVTTTLPKFSAFAFQNSASPPIAIGSVGEVEFHTDTPENSRIMYTVSLSTSGPSPAVSFVLVRVTSMGSNMPCGLIDDSLTFTKSATDGPNDAGTLTFTVDNYGFNIPNDTEPNKLIFSVTILIQPGDNVQENEEHMFRLSINDAGEKVFTITVGPQGDYPTTVNYGFDLTSPCPSNVFPSGSSMSFDIVITTERNVTAGEMVAKVPISSSSNVSNLAFCSAKVKNVGKNVICAKEGDLVPSSITSWLDDGVDDHATLRFEVMCNIQIIDDVNEDKFTIEITVQVKDSPEILLYGLNGTFAVGFVFSKTQMWIASYYIIIEAMRDLQALGVIKKVSFSDGHVPATFPDTSPVLQWSPDGVTFHDSPFTYEDPIVDSSLLTTSYDVKDLLVARYVRLTDKTCKSGCRPDHSIITETTDLPFTAFGTSLKKDTILANMMWAMDKDIGTCMDLPIKSDPTTPPALWAVIPTKASSGFNLTISGKSIQCNTWKDKQITMAMFQQDLLITGHPKMLQKCSYLDKDDSVTPLMKCHYRCECSGDECQYLAIIMAHKEPSPAEPYQLCEITISK